VPPDLAGQKSAVHEQMCHGTSLPPRAR
jgi:hypothetical protein